MICVDTTFLVDLWRTRHVPKSGARLVLEEYSGETFAVPAHAAGEFLEGGAAIGPGRLKQSLALLRLFAVGDVTLETARAYALIVAELRSGLGLTGRSKPDLWIAAWAVHHGAPLATRNIKHFKGIRGLELLEYAI
jgi:predicted nucleic acid-binding protein